MVDQELALIYQAITGRKSAQMTDGHWISTGAFNDPKRHMSGSWYAVPDVALPDGLMMWIEALHNREIEIHVVPLFDGDRPETRCDLLRARSSIGIAVGHGPNLYAAFEMAVRRMPRASE